jgi:hypothetical protein
MSYQKFLLITSSTLIASAVQLPLTSTADVMPPAAVASTSTTSISEVPTAPAEKRLGLALSLITKSSLHKTDDLDRSGTTALWFGPSVALTEKLEVAGLVVYTRDFEDRAEPNAISNAKLMLSHTPIPLMLNLKFKPLAAIRLPTNREAREDDRLRMGFSIEPALVLETRRLTTSYRLLIAKNIHDETLDREGSPNIEWNYSHLLKLSYKLTERVSFSVGGEHIASKTYRNFDRSKFDVSEEINVDAGQGFSIDLGHSNSGDALKPNLNDSNIALYNDQSSVLYLGVNYVY